MFFKSIRLIRKSFAPKELPLLVSILTRFQLLANLKANQTPGGRRRSRQDDESRVKSFFRGGPFNKFENGRMKNVSDDDWPGRHKKGLREGVGETRFGGRGRIETGKRGPFLSTKGEQ